MKQIKRAVSILFLLSLLGAPCFGSMMKEPDLRFGGQNQPNAGYITIILRITVLENGFIQGEAFVYAQQNACGSRRLVYVNARYLDPVIGRFISLDPVKDGSNWYAYCENNPLKYVDPTGMFGNHTTQTDCTQENYDEHFRYGYTSFVIKSFVAKYLCDIAKTNNGQDILNQLAAILGVTDITYSNIKMAMIAAFTTKSFLESVKIFRYSIMSFSSAFLNAISASQLVGIIYL